jgi:hypothetical protein
MNAFGAIIFGLSIVTLCAEDHVYTAIHLNEAESALTRVQRELSNG